MIHIDVLCAQAASNAMWRANMATKYAKDLRNGAAYRLLRLLAAMTADDVSAETKAELSGPMSAATEKKSAGHTTAGLIFAQWPHGSDYTAVNDRDFWNIVRRESAPRYDGADDARAELAMLMIARRFKDKVDEQPARRAA
jgi:hypothetical protein